MLRPAWEFARVGPAFVLGVILVVHPNLLAQTHVVTPAELQKEAVAATRARQHNVEAVTQFLSSPPAKQALRSAHLNATQVKTAVSSLSDEELAQLASRAEKAQADFAAGIISNHDLILIVLGLVALILIIIAVR
jgi:CHASE3 domain sensor protein